MARALTFDTVLAALDRPAPQPSSDYDLNPDVSLPPGRVLKPAAVLVGVFEDQIILTKRASHLKHHPGQIAFPGGKVDPEDDGAVDAALREAEEEIGLDRGNVDVAAQLPAHETVTSYLVTPVLARINRAFAPRPEAGEVAEVFQAPLDILLHPDRFRVERRRWRGQWRSYYVVPYGPYYVWGATARILKSIADRVSP